jgi:hypothetical protein
MRICAIKREIRKTFNQFFSFCKSKSEKWLRWRFSPADDHLLLTLSDFRFCVIPSDFRSGPALFFAKGATLARSPDGQWNLAG